MFCKVQCAFFERMAIASFADGQGTWLGPLPMTGQSEITSYSGVIR